MTINIQRLLNRLNTLGKIGRDSQDRLARIALTHADKEGRDQVYQWFESAELDIKIDKIGNIHAIWSPESVQEEEAIMMGSHIDTVLNAGIYDGNYGVLAGLEVIQHLQEMGFQPKRPIVVSIFTNEEGARYTPDMMGSLVYVGGLALNDALKTRGNDGSILGDELERIGYSGDHEVGFIPAKAYIELHIEQGPVLEKENITVGAVENLQGICWQQITINGTANHAGTTPMSMRNDAGMACARVMTYMRDYVEQTCDRMVTTFGKLKFEPDIINVVPSQACFTIDLRSPDELKLKQAEAVLVDYLNLIAEEESVEIGMTQMARLEPVTFDLDLVQLIEKSAKELELTVCRMTSGAGHDAQMMARICPAAMIFVPSAKGISHNPREYTSAEDLNAGVKVLLRTIKQLACH
ncbi:Zn-dependent hydrolase [Shewanella surugensis]|uniref:Zn-dependent hydrolase n=1 Tax=Shewanella surugensis TaxID=212020 RepID=A0ABT0L9W4_9GAMM|nr:Zn-dependent hydrolase [Shewanella surugensis]MCL1124275.1 Zn-dependent hydrolase [Shewanella surugensis]